MAAGVPDERNSTKITYSYRKIPQKIFYIFE
jgi:hypothetical protein